MSALANPVEARHGELSHFTTPELMERLKDAFQITAKALIEVAAIVRILEDRGEDLSSLKLGMIDWFRKIAHGQVLPEVFERYRLRPRLLESVASLPIPDQERLSADDAAIPVLTFAGEELSQRQVDPLELTPQEMKQVFTRGRLRSLSEQRGWLNDQTRKRRSAPQQEPNLDVVVNRKKQCVVINGVSLSRSQLLNYLSRLED